MVTRFAPTGTESAGGTQFGTKQHRPWVHHPPEPEPRTGGDGTDIAATQGQYEYS